MRRRGVVIVALALLIGALGLAAWTVDCMKGDQTTVVPLAGPPPEWLVGEWYSGDGWLDIVVPHVGSAGMNILVRSESWAGSCRPTSADATSEGLEFECRGGASDPLTVRLWPAEDSMRVLNWHNYWLYREPSWSWRVQRWWPRAKRGMENWAANTL